MLLRFAAVFAVVFAEALAARHSGVVVIVIAREKSVSALVERLSLLAPAVLDIAAVTILETGLRSGLLDRCLTYLYFAQLEHLRYR
jgi:hypothetical protein